MANISTPTQLKSVSRFKRVTYLICIAKNHVRNIERIYLYRAMRWWKVTFATPKKKENHVCDTEKKAAHFIIRATKGLARVIIATIMSIIATMCKFSQ